MMVRRRHLVLVFALAMALSVSAAHAGRIVAVGDVHGNFEGLTSILQEAGVLDENLKWVGGDTTYIQLGDLFDRGLKVRETKAERVFYQSETRGYPRKETGGRKHP